jgi:hypothetical protein
MANRRGLRKYHLRAAHLPLTVIHLAHHDSANVACSAIKIAALCAASAGNQLPSSSSIARAEVRRSAHCPASTRAMVPARLAK